MIERIHNIKYRWDNLSDNRRNMLRFAFVILIMIYLTLTADPLDRPVERSTVRIVFFWALNGLVIAMVSIGAILSWWNYIKGNKDATLLNALLCSFAVVGLLLFVMDIYNHQVFYSIKEFILNLFT